MLPRSLAHSSVHHAVLNIDPHGTRVTVEGTETDGYACGQPKFGSPFGGEWAHAFSGGKGLFWQAVGIAVQHRINSDPKFIGWVAAPAFMPHHFMAGGTAADAKAGRVGGIGQYGGHPVAVLHPGVSGRANGFGGAQRCEA